MRHLQRLWGQLDPPSSTVTKDSRSNWTKWCKVAGSESMCCWILPLPQPGVDLADSTLNQSMLSTLGILKLDSSLARE